jgi:DNA processing protein
MSACDRCVGRAWLLGRLAGHLEHTCGRIDEVLALGDDELIAAVGGRHEEAIRQELSEVDLARQRELAAEAELETICLCDARYPERLRGVAGAPAALFVTGGLERFLRLATRDPVAIVGARRATAYGLDVARSLGRALAASGVTVLSGMALGIDSAAHAGALSAGAATGRTVAVLPGPANRPYPAGRRALYRQILAAGNAVSELPPGAEVRRWSFPARNRIIAGLASMTVVVEAGARSGALVTAARAGELRRPVGAVPGRITTPQAAGSNSLLAAGACVVRGPQDVLDRLFGAGVRHASEEARPSLAPELRAVLAAIANGRDNAGALARAGIPTEQALTALAALELDGYVRREPGGRFTLVP